MTAPTPMVSWLLMIMLASIAVAAVIVVVVFRRNKQPPRGFDVLPPKDDQTPGRGV